MGWHAKLKQSKFKVIPQCWCADSRLSTDILQMTTDTMHWQRKMRSTTRYISSIVKISTTQTMMMQLEPIQTTTWKDASSDGKWH